MGPFKPSDMKTYSVNPEQEPQSSGSVVYRFVLALIIFICLSYVTFASAPHVQSANEPPVEFTSLTLIKVGAKLELKWIEPSSVHLSKEFTCAANDTLTQQ